MTSGDQLDQDDRYFIANDDADDSIEETWFTLPGNASVEFVVFHARLLTLGRWLEYQPQAVMRFLTTETKTLDESLLGVPSWALDSEYRDPAAADDAFVELRDWAHEVFPFAAFAGMIPLGFAALEELMSSLVELAQVDTRETFADFRRSHSDPQLQLQMLYLRDVAGWPIVWSREDRRHFGAAQTLRNKIAHSLGSNVSDDTGRTLGLFSDTGRQQVSWQKETVEGVYSIIGRFAQAIANAQP